MMGYIGDTYGRKKALEISIFLMAFPTFCMGCLPTYDQVGWVAIILLVIVRMLQGLSVGGQLMSSLVFTLESHERQKWGLYGSYVMAAANFGTLLGGIIGFTMRECLSPEALQSWGWRVPFLSGIFVSLSGVYLKCYCPEDDPHLYHAAPTHGNPIKMAFAKGNRRSLLASAMVPILWSAGFYLTFVWMAIYMTDLIEPPVPKAFAINSASLLLSVCLLFPVAGHLSDKYGRLIIMTIGGVGMTVLSPMLVMVVGQGNPVGAFLAQSLLGISLSFWGSPMCAWLVESFEPAARLTSVAIGYNLAQAIVGGATPALATVMVNTLGPNSPGFLLTGLAIISIIGLLCVAPREGQYDQVGSKDGVVRPGQCGLAVSSYAHPLHQDDEIDIHHREIS
jgi:MHS family proline/betaine transporter-like MFS transporter